MPSSRMTALLALLAVAGYQNRDKLGDIFGRITGQGPSGSAPGQAPLGFGVRRRTWRSAWRSVWRRPHREPGWRGNPEWRIGRPDQQHVAERARGSREQPVRTRPQQGT